MPKNLYLGAAGQARPGKFSITLSKADARDVRERIAVLGLDGPSAFFQRLISEARGARLPILFSERKAS